MVAVRSGILAVGALLFACAEYTNEVPTVKVSKPTTTLEAEYATTPPNTLSASYWKTANYLPITASNLITSQIPADDGLYNVSGTFNGLTDFNKGKDPKITLKAAYDENNVYILVSWRDTTFNLSSANWVFNGPTDPKKSGSTDGWTSQRSDDKMILSFDMGSSKWDVWNWSLALSEPMGFAIDMMDNGSGAASDAGNKMFIRNNAGADNRSGPQYEWDGVEQQITRSPGGLTILDPGFYYLTKQNFTGDALAGEPIYQTNCSDCHGVLGDGNGVAESAPAFITPGLMTRFSRASFLAFATSPSHEGSVHLIGLTDQEIDDLFARLRGFSGVPGYFLQNPTGSNSDVHALSNVKLGKVEGYNSKGYSVLLIRALSTGNPDDIAFVPANGEYNFNIDLSDNDDLNRIGANNQKITFKPK